ncbi:hypothetical protein GO755_03225 [Spirosoma sp. HMF4905]|uniref:Uncharacterized protein n=1 Tax=Spirosoma arboris TaxID=2682092 RepID=A0A7K1S5D1_9BACT|nr:hypothetical protein [Spirosoma arboris]MVM29032.1 hypothetical protein [Spirosoma arboris]
MQTLKTVRFPMPTAGSKHVGDQLLLLSQKKLRTALFTQEAVLKHLEEREQVPINRK